MSDIRTPWRAVSAMFALNGGLFGIWASRIPSVANTHALGPGELGALLLLMAAGAITSFPIAGRAADRFGAHWVTQRVAVAYTLALFLIAISPNVVTVAITLFIFGVTHGAMDVTMNAWGAEVERRIGRPVMSSFHAMFSLGAGVGAATGYVAASADVGVTAHFIIAGSLLAVLMLAMALIPWTADQHHHEGSQPVFVFPRGGLLMVGVIAFCSALGEGAMADWSAVFLVTTTGATEALAALGYTAFSVAMVVMRLLGDRVTAHFGPVFSARIAGLVAAAGTLIAVVSATYPLTLLGFVLMGLGYAVIMPLAFSRAANDAAIKPGAALASVSTLGYGGLLLGPATIGFLAEITSLRLAFLVLTGLALVIFFIAEAVKPE